jgi:PhoH-like ATPase
MTEKKIYVLDTSVLLSVGKRALFSFPNSEVVIPLPVIKELESKKSDVLVGFIARDALRALEKLRHEHGEDLKTGVPVGKEGSTVRIEVNHVKNSEIRVLQDGSTDSRIITIAHNLAQESDNRVVLVTNDLTMRILAQISADLLTEPFTSSQSKQGLFTGIVSATTSKENIDLLYKNKQDEVNNRLRLSDVEFAEAPQGKNVGVVLTGGMGGPSILAVTDGNGLRPIDQDISVFSVKGRSAEQKLALHYLLDSDKKIVSLGGPAGTGKTLLAVAAGLERVAEKEFQRVVVFRPLLAVGNQSLGYLPGTEEEKMAPWAAAVYDALETVGGYAQKLLLKDIVDQGNFEVLPITHIRGRTLSRTLIVIDEAQNLEKDVLLSILSRVGQDSKVVLSWDAAQKDNLNITQNEGIVALVDRLKSENLFAHVTLRKSERSEVAALASLILEENSSN